LTALFVWEKPLAVVDVAEADFGSFLDIWLPQMLSVKGVALIGDMGSGKTTFTRAVVKALDGDVMQVTSPTFSIKHKYPTPSKPVHHLDLYRMPDTPGDHAQLFADLEESEGLVLIEWADRFSEVLAYTDMALRFYFINLSVRRVHVYVK
jgi:tRNA threonylcarbamoyladenosine biosynthesis protein TsaE